MSIALINTYKSIPSTLCLTCTGNVSISNSLSTEPLSLKALLDICLCVFQKWLEDGYKESQTYPQPHLRDGCHGPEQILSMSG